MVNEHALSRSAANNSQHASGEHCSYIGQFGAAGYNVYIARDGSERCSIRVWPGDHPMWLRGCGIFWDARGDFFGSTARSQHSKHVFRSTLTVCSHCGFERKGQRGLSFYEKVTFHQIPISKVPGRDSGGVKRHYRAPYHAGKVHRPETRHAAHQVVQGLFTLVTARPADPL